MEESEQELSAELRSFIERIVVLLLVERLLGETRDLYSESPSYYNDTEAA
jgi:hypothetical protein